MKKKIQRHPFGQMKTIIVQMTDGSIYESTMLFMGQTSGTREMEARNQHLLNTLMDVKKHSSWNPKLLGAYMETESNSQLSKFRNRFNSFELASRT